MKETNITDEKIITCLRNELNKPDYKGYLREVDEEDLQTILTQLVNKSMHDDGSNVNTLISADDPEVANAYGVVIAEALEAVFSFEMCTPVTIEQLYQWNAEHRKDNPDTKVLLVKSFETSNPEALFNTLTEFQKQKFNPAVILCTSNDTVEELRKYSAQGSVLYNYLCGLRKIIIPGIVQEDIADIICDRLEGEGNEVKGSFREKLAVHVEAIYPEAVLSKEAFLEDLIIRIRSVHSGKSVDLWRVYDEEDVPFSVKAEALWEKIQIEGIKAEGDKKEKDEFIEDEEVSVESNEGKANLTGEKKHSVMLLAMSTLHTPLRWYGYIRPGINKEWDECNSEELLTGCKSQLEPVAKIMMETIGKGSFVDFVIMGTDKTNEEVEVDEDTIKIKTTAENYFIERIIEEYLNKNSGCHFTKAKEDTKDYSRIITYFDNEKNITIRFNIITIDEKNLLKGIGDTVKRIREIDNNEDGIDKDNLGIELWVDTHGGFRDITFIMASLLSILKSEGIEPQYKYGVHFNKQNPKQNKIIEQPKMFEMFDFVTGMNDFFNYGSASVLKEFKEKRKKRKNSQVGNANIGDTYNKADDDRFIDALNKIAQGTQFCDPYLYRSGVEDLIKYKEKNNKKKEHKEIDNELDIFEESIFNDFGNLLDMTPDSVDLDLAIIERCANKGLYQQALTFIETLMPRYFFEKKVFYCSEADKKKINEAKKKNDYRDKKCENIIFDSNLPWLTGKKNEKVTSIISQYAKSSFNDIVVQCDNEKMKEAVFKDMYYNDNKKFNDNHTVNTYGLENELEIPVMTEIDYSFRKIIAEIFFIHSVLKQCRNIFNHGMASENDESGDNGINGSGIVNNRPSIEDIDKVIKKYVNNVRKIKVKG